MILTFPNRLLPPGDNRRLADRNGPRLTEFLKRLETDFPARFQVESLRYSDQGYRYGFRLPAR